VEELMGAGLCRRNRTSKYSIKKVKTNVSSDGSNNIEIIFENAQQVDDFFKNIERKVTEIKLNSKTHAGKRHR
jgi:hypothetical protein